MIHPMYFGPLRQLPPLAEPLHPGAPLLLGSAGAWAWEPRLDGLVNSGGFNIVSICPHSGDLC